MIYYMFKQKTKGHLIEGLGHRLGSSVRSSSGMEVDNFQAHQLVLICGYREALDPCPMNKVSHGQENGSLSFLLQSGITFP